MKNALLKYLIALLLLGSNGIVASMIHMDSTEIVFLRALIGGIFLVGVFMFSKKKLQIARMRKRSIYLVMSGIAMGAQWLFLFESYRYVGVSIGLLACYCGPILIMVAAALIFKEKLTQPKVLGLVTVILGMLCVNGIAILDEGLSWGLFCGFMSAIMFAVMIICSKKVTGISGLETSMWQLIVGCVFIGAVLVITNPGTIAIPVESIVPLLFLGIVGTGFGFLLYFSAMQQLSAQTVSVCGYLEPLSAIVLSSAVLGERLTLIQIVGAILILSGAAFGELLGSKRVKRVFRRHFRRHQDETLVRG